MPFQSPVKLKTKISSNESESECDKVNLENEITSIQREQNETKKTVYWVTHNEPTFNEDAILSFYKNDILIRKIKPHDCKKLLINGYGPRTSKIDRSECHDIITKRHNFIRDTFRKDFKSSLEDLWTRVAVIIGMRDGRSQYHYNDIVKHVTANPTFSTICRLQYLIRGIFDNHTQWKIKMERKLMNKYHYIYRDDFNSEATSNGCFASIISDVYVQKNRDINRRLANKHNFILVQRSQDHRNINKKGRMPADNQSYFGLIKNVEYKKEDENEKRKFMEILKQTTPKTVNFQNNGLGEIHYTILENIVFPKGSLSKVNKIVANWIGDLPDIPPSPNQGNLIEINSLHYNNELALKQDFDDKEGHEVEVVHDVQKPRSDKKDKNNKRKKVLLSNKEMKAGKKRRCQVDSDSDWEETVRKPSQVQKVPNSVARDDESLSTYKDCIQEEDEFDLLFHSKTNNEKTTVNKIDKVEQKLLDSVVAHEESVEQELKEIIVDERIHERKHAGKDIKNMVSRLSVTEFIVNCIQSNNCNFLPHN